MSELIPHHYDAAEGVIGELVGTTLDSLSIGRVDPQVGELCVHFPKLGCRCEAV